LPCQPHLLAAVLEDHTIDLPSKVTTSLIIIDTKLKTLNTFVSGADFYSMPKFSPNSKRIAWWQWSHPDMPWEGGEIYVADVILREEFQLSVERPLHVAGKKEAIGAGYPAWANDERLIFTSDESGFTNPYKFENSRTSPLLATPLDEDFAQCYWMLHFFPYAILDEEGSTGVFSAYRDGRNILYLVDLDGGSEPKLIENSFALVKGIRSVSRKDHQSVMFAQKQDEEDSIVQLSLTPPDKLELRVIKPASPLKVDGVPLSASPCIISLPQPLKLRVGSNGDPLYVVYYPPHNPDFSGTSIKEEKPPCVVNVHGGPTSFTPQGLNWTKQYFTSRGWAW
jgi:dipeptidyl aminopeptidase/acylaminoacyl peptidase